MDGLTKDEVQPPAPDVREALARAMFQEGEPDDGMVAEADRVLAALAARGLTVTLRDRTVMETALRDEVRRLSMAGWPHQYDDGIHRSPDCYGCERLARLEAVLASEGTPSSEGTAPDRRG